ncbi:hypothetical protein [Amycolatopsis tolypomycina]|uniref:Uncharacterized protein n=1 Tax=Amycolatopsis tolypomycina TaxID=208445 RepID=A0A1H4Q4S0_9PSEU|nr:hypothetical protein [Amycolatopsis tolypomycina]SEC14637.1 hypothetical protein SAMN04489727_2733 [Amycolatopsis tolypomycina]
MAASGEVLNPVSDVPVFGDLIGLVDTAATQIGFSLPFRAFGELIIVGVLAFVLLRLVTARLLPWAGNALVRPVTMLTQALLVLLLLPDLGVARLTRHFGRKPPEAVYGYGAAVLAVVESAEELIRRGLPKLGLTRALRPWALIVLLVAGFLLWNQQDCAAGAAPTCASPVEVWLASFGAPDPKG